MSDAIVPKGQPITGDPEKKGWLFKWTNYLKGYQRRWFVLSNGLLSYYRNQAEMAHTCRGTISLLGALIHTADSCTFVISNGGTQTFHIRAHDEVERQSWVTALELAKAKAIRAQESDEDDDQLASRPAPSADGDAEDAGGIARELAARFHDLRTCSELVARHGAALQRSLVELEAPPSDQAKQVAERATLFRISCNAMMNACSEFMSAAAASSARMSRALQHERDQKMRLQEVVEQLARQHDSLEKTVTARRTPNSGGTGSVQGHETEDEDHEFFDAVEVPSTMEDKTALVMKVPDKEKSIKAEANPMNLRSTPGGSEKGNFIKAETSLSKLSSPPGSSAMGNTIKTEASPKNLNLSPCISAMGNTIKTEASPKNLNLSPCISALEKTIKTEASPKNLNLSTGKSGMEKSIKLEPLAQPGNSVSRKQNKAKGRDSSDESEGETVKETQQLTFREDKVPGPPASSMGGPQSEGKTQTAPSTPTAATASTPGAVKEIKIWPHVSQIESFVDGHPRRSRVPDRPNYPLSLWSIMKNCIGKELSKIPIPVNFSEPLSMLQRLTEEYEYSSVLDQAAKFSDPAQQLAYVAAFTVSSYATTSCRTNKPFNPLLGETFECDRMADLGWRSISEQVSHHPPMVAQFCEGVTGWQCWQEFTMTTKFRGKYLQIIPLGGASCMFPSSGNKYSWRKVMHHPPTSVLHCEAVSGWYTLTQFSFSSRFRGQFISINPMCTSVLVFPSTGNKYSWEKVTTTVHNIIVGKLWVDNHGDMDIVGEAGPAAGYVAHLKYLPYGYFSKDTQRKVTGVIKDPNGVPRYVLQGHWDDSVEVAPVTSASLDNTQCTTGKFAVAWQRVPEPPDSDKWYNFTLLAAQLNESEKGVAPTDSRLRPDQRLMEEGLWDEANVEKVRLEEKQRLARRQLEADAEAAAASGRPAPRAPRPLWFTPQAVTADADTRLRHIYNNRYWECKQRQDWSQCPQIF